LISIKTRIITASVLIAFFFVVLIILPPIYLSMIIAVICGIAAYELLNAAGISKNKSVLIYTIIAAALVPMSVFLSLVPFMSASALFSTNAALDTIPSGTPVTTAVGPYSTLLLLTLLFSIIFIFICLLIIEAVLGMKNAKAIEKGKQLKFRQIPIALVAGILIPYMLSTLINLKSTPYGYLVVMLPVVATVITDSGAYFTGVTIGKRKAFPTISPNKTVEGYIGGTIAGIAGMLIYGLILFYTTPLTVIFPILILYGILGAIMTELGDLTFSLIKRKCGIKDFGKLFPGHGGALDRFDSMIFAAPTMYLLLLLLPALIM